MYLCMFYIYIYMHLFLSNVKADEKIFYYFGMNVLNWCPFVHLFYAPFQNSP